MPEAGGMSRPTPISREELVALIARAIYASQNPTLPPEGLHPQLQDVWRFYEPAAEAVCVALHDAFVAAPDLLDLLREARSEGLIYWEPQTSAGAARKAQMLAKIDRALAKAKGED